jgi:hypothetical protein
MNSEDSAKIIMVEMQKSAQVRSEMLNILVEMELFTSQQEDIKKRVTELYMKKIADRVQGGESAPSYSEDFNLNVPTKDLEFQCFPIIRRKYHQSVVQPKGLVESLQNTALFDI